MDLHSFYLLDPDRHSEKLLDPDPQKMNEDPSTVHLETHPLLQYTRILRSSDCF